METTLKILLWLCVGAMGVFAIAGITVTAQDTVANPSQPAVSVITNQSPAGIEVIRIPLSPVAVDLEIIGDRRYILWSDGRITTSCPEDVDGDGVISILDQIRVKAAMGKPCPE